MYRFYVGLCLVLFAPTAMTSDYNPSLDLISLHYDFAPDRDDGHASAAARSLMGKYDVEFIVVTGAFGTNANRYLPAAAALQDRIWGAGNHLNAHDDWALAVDTAARYWGRTIEQGGRVFVAEGGQSDFTADVVRKMTEDKPGRLGQSSVTVVQHSLWNENMTSRADLQYVKKKTRYIKIPDGNHRNQTADLNMKSARYVAWATSGVFAEVWKAAFSFLDPERQKLDFSDTVELLYILGIGKDKVHDPESFGEFVEGSEGTGIKESQNVSVSDATEVIVVEAESFVEADAEWVVQERQGSRGGGSVKLLPDTRITHSDPLIHGVNFWGSGGEGPELTYAVNIPKAGDYVVSVRAFSTGTEDNSIHVGVNGEFPESGARMQWCKGKHQWTWSSAQRTSSNHCGVQGSIRLNIASAGINTVMFSAREDGFEFDAFRLELIQENGSTLSGQTLALISSDTYQVALREKMQGRVDAVSAAFDTCGHLSGADLTTCTNQSIKRDTDKESSVQELVEAGKGQVCTATGDTLRKARGNFARQCPMPVFDCDPIGGAWTCSSIKIGRAAPRYSRGLTAAQQSSGGQTQSQRSVITTTEESVETINDTDTAQREAPGESSTASAQTGGESVSSVKTRWSDSYSVDGQCFCDSTFDHGIGDEMIETQVGLKTVREVCGAVAARFGQGSGRNRVYYNTIQCGHGPTNGFYDEARCPGFPSNELNYTGPDCGSRGAQFNLESLYQEDTGEQPEVPVDSGQWWQPQGSQNLTWYMQFQGTLNLNYDADVYFLDTDVDKSVVDRLKSQGKKVMCYISAGSTENWRSDFSRFPESVKGNDYHGWPGERWLDITNKSIVYPLMEARMDVCKAKGFDGIDADNVNTHVNNTGFDINRADAITYIRWLANESHKRGMAYSLKNAEDLASAVVDDVDMLQSESCFVYNNCSAAKAIREANKPVWMVEYDSITRDWSAACQAARANGFSAILRDVLLTGSGVYRQCL